MSYGVTAFAVNLNQIEEPFGSQDEELKNEIVSQVKERFDSIDEQLGGTPMVDITDDYFKGEINHADDAKKYWYLIETLCIGFGRKLSNDHWYPFKGATEPWYDHEQFKLYGINTKPFLPSPDDFPLVFVLGNADLQDAYEAINEQGEKDVYSIEQVRQFSDWIENAQKDRWDLVLFYY